MGTILLLVGLVFLVSGGLSILKISQVGLDFVSKTQIHTLPFLKTYPSAWVYVAVGIVLMLIAGVFSRR